MAPDGVPVEPSFVQLATDRGLRRIVLLSSQSIEAMGDARLLAAERTVRDSGADWTILRAAWFHQNFDEGFFRVVRQVTGREPKDFERYAAEAAAAGAWRG